MNAYLCRRSEAAAVSGRSGVRADFYFIIPVFNRYTCNTTSETNPDNLHIKP